MASCLLSWGKTGPEGPAGPQGTPGVSGYQVVFTPLLTISINGNQTTTVNASCPAGKNVIGGIDGSGTVASLVPIASFPFSADTWRVMIRLNQVPAASFQVRVYAVCAAM